MLHIPGTCEQFLEPILGLLLELLFARVHSSLVLLVRATIEGAVYGVLGELVPHFHAERCVGCDECQILKNLD